MSSNAIADNLQVSVESWITNLDSLDIYSLDRVLSGVYKIFYFRQNQFNHLFHIQPFYKKKIQSRSKRHRLEQLIPV